MAYQAESRDKLIDLLFKFIHTHDLDKSKLEESIQEAKICIDCSEYMDSCECRDSKKRAAESDSEDEEEDHSKKQATQDSYPNTPLYQSADPVIHQQITEHNAKMREQAEYQARWLEDQKKRAADSDEEEDHPPKKKAAVDHTEEFEKHWMPVEATRIDGSTGAMLTLCAVDPQQDRAYFHKFVDWCKEEKGVTAHISSFLTHPGVDKPLECDIEFEWEKIKSE
jgi:hypothetical protein